jgi:hypothetical protein
LFVSYINNSDTLTTLEENQNPSIFSYKSNSSINKNTATQKKIKSMPDSSSHPSLPEDSNIATQEECTNLSNFNSHPCSSKDNNTVTQEERTDMSNSSGESSSPKNNNTAAQAGSVHISNSCTEPTSLKDNNTLSQEERTDVSHSSGHSSSSKDSNTVTQEERPDMSNSSGESSSPKNNNTAAQAGSVHISNSSTQPTSPKNNNTPTLEEITDMSMSSGHVRSPKDDKTSAREECTNMSSSRRYTSSPKNNNTTNRASSVHVSNSISHPTLPENNNSVTQGERADMSNSSSHPSSPKDNNIATKEECTDMSNSSSRPNSPKDKNIVAQEACTNVSNSNIHPSSPKNNNTASQKECANMSNSNIHPNSPKDNNMLIQGNQSNLTLNKTTEHKNCNSSVIENISQNNFQINKTPNGNVKLGEIKPSTVNKNCTNIQESKTKVANEGDKLLVNATNQADQNINFFIKKVIRSKPLKICRQNKTQDSEKNYEYGDSMKFENINEKRCRRNCSNNASPVDQENVTTSKNLSNVTFKSPKKRICTNSTSNKIVTACRAMRTTIYIAFAETVTKRTSNGFITNTTRYNVDLYLNMESILNFDIIKIQNKNVTNVSDTSFNPQLSDIDLNSTISNIVDYLVSDLDDNCQMKNWKLYLSEGTQIESLHCEPAKEKRETLKLFKTCYASKEQLLSSHISFLIETKLLETIGYTEDLTLAADDEKANQQSQRLGKHIGLIKKNSREEHPSKLEITTRIKCNPRKFNETNSLVLRVQLDKKIPKKSGTFFYITTIRGLVVVTQPTLPSNSENPLRYSGNLCEYLFLNNHKNNVSFLHIDTESPKDSLVATSFIIGCIRPNKTLQSPDTDGTLNCPPPGVVVFCSSTNNQLFCENSKLSGVLNIHKKLTAYKYLPQKRVFPSIRDNCLDKNASWDSDSLFTTDKLLFFLLLLVFAVFVILLLVLSIRLCCSRPRRRQINFPITRALDNDHL